MARNNEAKRIAREMVSEMQKFSRFNGEIYFKNKKIIKLEMVYDRVLITTEDGTEYNLIPSEFLDNPKTGRLR
jgi:hypothetical protein